jgi:hypothetical protein
MVWEAVTSPFHRSLDSHCSLGMTNHPSKMCGRDARTTRTPLLWGRRLACRVGGRHSHLLIPNPFGARLRREGCPR